MDTVSPGVLGLPWGLEEGKGALPCLTSFFVQPIAVSPRGTETLPSQNNSGSRYGSSLGWTFSFMGVLPAHLDAGARLGTPVRGD